MSESEKSEEGFENVIEFDLPQNILERYDLEQQIQLMKGYRLLQVLLYYKNNKPFFDKPDNDVLGTKRYYDIIKNPMWLFEIKRKFFNAEYQSLFEVIKDIRLILENCYFFWGPRASLTEQCLHMEKQFEQQLSLLPKDLKSLCTLFKTHGDCDPIVHKVWNQCKNRGKSCSNLMLRVWRRRRLHESEMYRQKSNISAFYKYGKQLLRWERDVLSLSNNCCSIFSMQELPEIGLFLQFIRNQFNVGQFCQCEIERMLLMPQYSSLFCRSSSILLDNTKEEPLHYEEVHAKLFERVSYWYEVSYQNSAKLQDFPTSGIDPNFFELVGRSNPFSNAKRFETLSFYQRVIIFRALCDDWIRQRPSVNELIMNTTEADSFVQKLGYDKYGYAYVYCSQFPDFRMYKLQLQMQDNQCVVSHVDVCETDSKFQQLPLKHLFTGKAIVTDCELKADSLDQLRCFIDELYYNCLESSKKDCKEPQSMLVQALLKLEANLYSKEDEFIQISNECRIRLFKEWCKGSGRDELLHLDDVDEETKPVENSVSISTVDKDGSDNDDEEEEEREDRNEGKEDENREESLVSADEVTNEKSDGDINHVQISYGCLGDKSRVKNPDLEHKKCSSFETSEERRIRKRKKKKKKRKRKHKSKVYEGAQVKLNELLPEELKIIVKEEPMDEENHSDKSTHEHPNDNKTTDMNEEIPIIKSNAPSNNRRCRSSAPLYSVYQNGIFSDEDESAEEMYFSEQDSDDEWEIPCKRWKHKRSKPIRQFRSTTTPVENDGSNYSISRVENLENQTCTSDSAINNYKEDLPPSNLNFVPEIIIKEENIQIEKCNSLEEVNKVSIKEEEKPVQKIKVIDFAKLMNSSTSPMSPSVKTLKPIKSSAVNSNAYIVCPTSAGSKLPVIRTTFPQPQQSNMYIRQQMVHKGYIIAASNQQQSLGSMNSNLLPVRYSHAGMIQPAATPRIVQAQSINPACPNQKADFKQAIPTNQAQMISMSPKLPQNANKFVFVNPVTAAKNPTLSYIIPLQNNCTPLQKIGQNVVADTKPMQRRPGVREIEGTIGIHANRGGIMQYIVKLANGSHVPLSNEQVQKLREGNSGALPTKLKIPVPIDVAEKIEPCVIIDD